MSILQLKGFINNDYKVIYDSGELTSAQTSLTISGLNGDVDEEYRLIIRAKNDHGSGDANYYLLFNNDTGANYGKQNIRGVNATASARRDIGESVLYMSSTAIDDTKFIFLDCLIYAKSGYVRTAITQWAGQITGTTVGNIFCNSSVWNNTTDNIISIVIGTDASNALGIGSRIILLKKANIIGTGSGIKEIIAGTRKGSWEKIYKTTLTQAATNVTISSLNGNSDILYRLKTRFVNNYNVATNMGLRLNNDSTTDIYGVQMIYGSDIYASAWRQKDNWIFLGDYSTVNEVSIHETIIYAKSGYIRTELTQLMKGVVGTTIGTIRLQGDSWNNTVDNITSLVILADQTNGLGIGTVIELERLNLS